MRRTEVPPVLAPRLTYPSGGVADPPLRPARPVMIRLLAAGVPGRVTVSDEMLSPPFLPTWATGLVASKPLATSTTAALLRLLVAAKVKVTVPLPGLAGVTAVQITTLALLLAPRTSSSTCLVQVRLGLKVSLMLLGCLVLLLLPAITAMATSRALPDGVNAG